MFFDSNICLQKDLRKSIKHIAVKKMRYLLYSSQFRKHDGCVFGVSVSWGTSTCHSALENFLYFFTLL